MGLLPVSIAALAAAAAVAAAPATYSDPAGDSGRAPDVTSLTIDGALRVAATVHGMAPRTSVSLYLDVDRNAATGSFSGSEYAVEFGLDAAGVRWTRVLRWRDGTWAALPPPAGRSLEVAGDVWTLTVPAAELGGATSFTFYAISALSDGGGHVLAYDTVPDRGNLVYEPPAAAPAAPAAKPWIGAPTITPAARAGARVTVAFPIRRGSGTVVADVRVGGRKVAHAEAIGPQRATVRLTIPKTARKQLLRVVLTIREGERSARRTATFRVG